MRITNSKAIRITSRRMPFTCDTLIVHTQINKYIHTSISLFVHTSIHSENHKIRYLQVQVIDL